jgi:hypothetical protein
VTDSTESAGLKALRYAEEKLHVNTIFEEVCEVRDDLDKLLTDLSELRDRRRDLTARLADKEMEVAADEWGKHPDMAVSRMEKHVKVAFSNDGEIRGYREELAKVTGDIEGLEFDKEIHEANIKIAVARMHELGGYFAYLAAIKNSASGAQ